MTRLIDITYFVSERQLPSDIDAGRINLFIDKYQGELLTDVLGYRLYKAFNDVLAAATATEPVALPQRFIDLRDGADYEDASGRLRRWVGLVDAGTKRSFIANYVYCKWLRNKESRTSSQGEKKDKSSGSDAASPARKFCTSWNEMSLWIEELLLFLRSLASTYPEFAEVNPAEVRRIYRPANPLGI